MFNNHVSPMQGYEFQPTTAVTPIYKSNPEIGRQDMVKIAVNITIQRVRQTLTDRESMILVARLVKPYVSPNCFLPKTRSTVTIMMRATKNLLISILQRRMTYACQPRNTYCSFTTYFMGSSTVLQFQRCRKSM